MDKQWPLTFIDHQKKKRKIYLKSGEMLLYESAKNWHGRQFPFEGEFFDNVFVHFFPNIYTFQELEEKLQSLSNWEFVADIGQIHLPP